MKIPTLKVEYIEVSRLKNDPDNPRIIKGPQFKVLCESIKANPDYFETRPILARPLDGNGNGAFNNTDILPTTFQVFAGNMRLRAAIEIGLKEVPVVVMNVTPEKERELKIRDNVSSGEWNADMLLDAYEVSELAGFGLDVADIFGKEIKPSDLADEKMPEKVEPTAKRGEIYQLGNHRVMCGDATNPNDLALLMGG